jgi:signal transduction histidine kinase
MEPLLRSVRGRRLLPLGPALLVLAAALVGRDLTGLPALILALAAAAAVFWAVSWVAEQAARSRLEECRLEEELLQSQKMAAIGQLSSGIAHEINTPLTGISSYCQFLLDNPGGKDNRELIVKMQDQVLRANKIVRTLLDFSRQKGQQALPVDLNQVLDESLALGEHKLKKKSIVLRRENEFKRRVHGFPTRLQQLFINLFINAIDAIDDEGWISISGDETDEQVTVRFKDNGHGIRDRELEKIFDPFFTTKEVGQGTGLGLAIVYNIVKEHYGDIEVHSKVGHGTTFIITFPLLSPLRSMSL